MSESIDDLVREVTSYVTALQAENAKLREERDHWHVEQVHAFGNWKDAHKKAVELQAENAKLRELVLARFACDSDACESCADCQLPGSKPFRCVEVARELCVEMD